VRALGSVRVRTTLAAVVVVGIALALGAVALVRMLRASLVDGLLATAELRAEEVATALEQGAGPAFGDDDELLVQILAGGTVVAASEDLEGRGSLRTETGIRVTIGDDRYVVAVEDAAAPAGERTVVVAASIDDVGDAVEALAGSLAWAAPLLLVLVGATTWVVAGRALAPVEAIRGEVEAITTAEIHRRVSVPPGGDEVARLAATMNGMLDRLEEGQRRQQRFVADASHELRSPVASLRQHAEVARAHPEGASVGALTEVVLAESIRVQRLVDDLLLLARADERSLEVRRRPVDLDDAVFAEAQRLRGATDLRIDTREVSAGRVLGDEPSLRRVLRNLGDNAARHAATTVAFGLAEVDGRVVLSVDDDGPGIPAAERRRVLERFVRLDEARARDTGGAGLGLAIVAEVVTAHGGRVTVDDSVWGGARLRVDLPAAS
jgi:signal transduction histidine kinase